ncbi:hypothetical protein T265_02456 [Opisthorchis viverrini]|uniref:Uncharacterized protein n=1 Tax=Opisthorchis viverrini TaxID=6198 RepID=A0A075A6K0_OPIVI|nr:hypothetical protein T265_02456 [Opisthorchis viverrini]KER31265.1 hypothetical protein T265_02456 [Opisthorchis viverrini]
MHVAPQKLDCIRKWMDVIVPKKCAPESTDGLVLLELIDLMNNGNLALETSSTEADKVVLKVLQEFYGTNVEELLASTKDSVDSYTTYGRCCLQLLVLAMGLRRRCKVFMSAAFKLQPAMHYAIVELMQPLISEQPISLASFSGLNVDSENQQLTPIRRGSQPRTPLTCPAGGRLLFGQNFRLNKTGVASTTFTDDYNVGLQLKSSPPKCSPSTFPASSPVLLADRRLRTVVDWESEIIDSPLYSLKSILDSPSLIPKSQYIAKLDEARHLSARLAEVEHLYEESSMETEKLNSAYRSLELQYQELEVRCKRREAEVSELRDELTFERESRLNCEQELQRFQGLRERFNSVVEELKSRSRVFLENQDLHKQLTHLHAKMKSLENLRSRLTDQQILQQEHNALCERLRIADETILRLTCEREERLALSEAEAYARVQDSHCRRYYRSLSQFTPHASDTLILSPDSSQPEILDNAHIRLDADEPVPSPILSPRSATAIAHCPPENLSSVVAVNQQINDLEHVISDLRQELQDAHRECVRWQCRAIAAQALSAHRLHTTRELQEAVSVAAQKVASTEVHYAEKFTWLESQLQHVKSRVKHAEEAMRTCELNRKSERAGWVAKCEALAKQCLDELTEELRSHTENEKRLEAELARMTSSLNDLKATAESDLQSLEHQMNSEVHILHGTISELQETIREKTAANELLQNQVKEQLEANDAYRTASEKEVDCLRNQLNTLSSELATLENQREQQYRTLQCRLNTEIEQLKDISESASRQAAHYQIALQEASTRAESDSKKLAAAVALADSKESELTRIRSTNTELQERCSELEANLTVVSNRATEQENLRSELAVRLHQLETDKSMLEVRCSALDERVATLESEVKHQQERVRQYKEQLAASQQDRTELERRAALLRDSARELETNWMHSQTLLTQARSQLAQVEQALHETKLELQRAEYYREEAAQRLARVELRQMQGKRLVRSTVSLFNVSRSTTSAHPVPEEENLMDVGTDSSQLIHTPVQANDNVGRGANTSFTFVSPLSALDVQSEIAESAVQAPSPESAPHLRDVAVQKCGTHLVSNKVSNGSVSNPYSLNHAKWTSDLNSTVTVSPAGLRRGSVFHGGSPKRHARRFCRLLIVPEKEVPKPAMSTLETQNLPKKQRFGSSVVAMGPSHGNQSKAEPDVSIASESQQLSLIPKTSSNPATAIVKGLTYIPETPVPWNAPPNDLSRSNLNTSTDANSSVASVCSAISEHVPGIPIAEAGRQLSLPVSSLKKGAKLWRPKIPKRLKRRSPNVGGVLGDDGKVDPFVKPLRPVSHSKSKTNEG